MIVVKFSTLRGGVFIEVKNSMEYQPMDRCFVFDKDGNAKWAYYDDLISRDPAPASEAPMTASTTNDPNMFEAMDLILWATDRGACSAERTGSRLRFFFEARGTADIPMIPDGYLPDITHPEWPAALILLRRIRGEHRAL